MSQMSHFSLPQWVDYARGVRTGPAAAEIARHLEIGCASCESSYRLWRRMVEFADAERGDEEPPEAVVRSVKNAFAGQDQRPPAESEGSRVTTMARLLFDSMSQPLAFGTRSGGATPRYALYEAGTWAIDIGCESATGRSRVHVTGQVVESGNRVRPGAALRITLRSQSAELLEFRTGAFGEFECQVRPEQGLELVVDVEGNSFSIPLGPLLPPDTDQEG